MSDREEFEKAYDSGEIYIISRNSSVIFGDIYKHEAWAAWQAARQAPASGEPEWANAPKWANWLARDADGDWYWFEHKPEPEAEGWDDSKTSSQNAHEIAWCGQPCDCWKQTLQERPTPPQEQNQ